MPAALRSRPPSPSAGHCFQRLQLVVVSVILLSLLAQPYRVTAADQTADLSVEVIASRDHLKRGQEVTLSIHVTNMGPDPASGIVLGVGCLIR